MKEYSKGIYVKFKPEEVEILHNRMKEAGVQNMSAYIGKMALNGYVIIPEWPDLNQVISLHSRISNNLNQYARKANETGTLSIYYTDKNTGKETAHSLRKYSDSFLYECAYEDISSIHGLWVNEDKTKGLRFLPDGILWVYSGIDSEKCKWKDSDGNSIAMLDSFGFSEKVPFARIGDNLLVYDGEKYYKAD